jgi:putative inorganic carbon (hco3(-)) transporter
MRDILVVGLVLYGSLMAIRRPWIGVLLWAWISLMNPHRYTYGFAYTAPVAALAAAATLLGLLFTRDRYSPMRGAPVVFLVLLMFWVTLSWLFGMDPEGDYSQWDKVMKVYLMTLVTLALLHSKQQLFAFVWVCAGSLALLGLKGGIFTIMHGGNYRVWGPPGTFIGDNNEFSLALIITIPLLRFLQMQLDARWARHLMTVAMLLLAAAALGSHSRGGLIAIIAMAMMLWWRGRNKFMSGILIITATIALLTFMPEQWTDRMSTISSYEEDRSAIGRLSAWWTAWGIAKNYPFGTGFDMVRPALFAQFSPYPDAVHAAHSIYFLILGNHGFVGLFLFLGIFVSTWFIAGRLEKHARRIPEALWVADLAAMCKVALVGYGVGGAFLSLSYWDLPYFIMCMVLVARDWLNRKGWQTEPAQPAGWKLIPGLVRRQPAAA